MVEGIMPQFGGLDKDLEIILDSLLTDVIIQSLRSESCLLSGFSYI
jgi:hypothetical protein